MDINIKRLDPASFDDFFSLLVKMAEYEKLDPPDLEAKKRLSRDGLSKNPAYNAFVAELEHKVVGFVIFSMTYSTFLALPTLFLEDIFVLEEFRGKGIGKELFAFVVREAKKRNCGRIDWCALSWNTPAIEFYKKNHAQELDWIFFRLTKDKFDLF